MDIKSEVRNLEVYAGCQQDAEASRNARAAISYGRLVGDSIDAISRWADMAEAALALAEYQATSGYDPEVDRSTYLRQRGELWDAYMAARAKAKAISQQ